MSFAALASRRLFARLLSTLLCAILVVLHPFSKYGGPSAFLALTLKELVFSVQDSLAQQLEVTILHLAGGLVAIAISLLAKYLATLAGTTTLAARSILAMFLMLTSFAAGWLKSRLPRLTLSMRIACFISIWLLTTETDQSKLLSKQVKPYLWIILTPAITSLFASLVVLRWSSPQFACDLAAAFSELHSCLVYNLSDVFFQKDLEVGSLRDSPLREQLMGRTIALSTVYRQTAFDLRIGRISMKSIKPLIGIAEHIRRELSWGMSVPRPNFGCTAPEATAIQNFHDPAFELGHAILDSMRIIEKVVLSCFVHTIFPRSVESEKAALFAAKRRLTAALSAVRLELKKFCDDWNAAASQTVDVPRNIFDLCLFMISLLQMAHEAQYALETCIDAISTFEVSSLRLWYPRLTLAWLGMTPSTITLDERVSFIDEMVPEVRTALTKEEALQAVAERGYTTLRCEDTKPLTLEGPKLSFIWLRSLAYYAWNCPKVLRGRLEVSRTLKALQHSPHLHHAFKNAAGVALLSIPAFHSVNSPAQRWFTTYFGQWMLISYVWVLETNSGATWRVAYLRLTGTIVGACYACVASYIFQTNPYGLVSAIALAEISISWVVINTKVPSLGVVTSVSMPPILFTPYLIAGPHPSPLILASLRAGMIALGLLAALLMNSILYPRHCRVLFLDSAYHTIGHLNQLYMSLSRNLFQSYQNSSMIEKQRILKLEYAVRKALHRMSILLSTMGDEISLVPKPMQLYHNIIIILSRLLDTLIGLRKVRENIPRKETVDAVAPQRREMISTVCISLFAAEQVFRGRQPLPQFLPSLHGALETLKCDIQDCIHRIRMEETGSLGLPVIYALAEIDAMTDMVDTVEQLLAVSRQLFGTSTWLQQTSLDLTITMSLHEDVGSRLRGH